MSTMKYLLYYGLGVPLIWIIGRILAVIVLLIGSLWFFVSGDWKQNSSIGRWLYNGSGFRMVRCVRLFLGLVWREWEPRSTGIPEKFRFKIRLSVRDAWLIARITHAPHGLKGAPKE